MDENELRIKIAKAKNIHIHDLFDYRKDQKSFDDYTTWRCRKCKQTFRGLRFHEGLMIEDTPDWPRSIAAAWELFLEMTEFGIVKISNGDGDSKDVDFFPYSGKNLSDFHVIADTYEVAICEVWLAWKEAAAT